MKIINLEGHNFWFHWLLPFDEKEKDLDCIVKYQEENIGRGIYGIGWRGKELKDEFDALYKDKEKKINSPGIVDKFLGIIKKRSAESAARELLKINAGDYMMTRLRNGRVFIGRVAKTPYFFEDNKDIVVGIPELETPRISFGGKVEEWVEFFCDDLPGDLLGRLAQQYHPTIQKINDWRLCVLIRDLYNEGAVQRKTAANADGSCQKVYGPKLSLTAKNFASSLDPYSLEDLVAFYITKEHAKDGYYFRPSSCKRNEPTFEFRFVAPGNKKPITCQVKNRKDVKPEDYQKFKDNYERIYLFSGLWQPGKQPKNDGNIICIDPTVLYEFFRDQAHSLLPGNFAFDNAAGTAELLDRLKFLEFSEHKKKQWWKNCMYKDSDDYVEIHYDNTHLYYYSVFDAIIIEKSDDMAAAEALVTKLQVVGQN